MLANALLHRCKSRFVLLPLLCVLGACAQHPPRADWLASGLIDCVPAGSVNAKGEPQTCETSAILIRGEQVLIANDKAVLPPAGSVFALPKSALDGDVPYAQLQFVTTGALATARKIEELAGSQHGDLNLAITAFDRDPQTEQNNPTAFNRLLSMQGTEFAAATTWPNSAPDSMQLRPYLRRALASTDLAEGPAYYKIEGMGFDDAGHFWLGIRETGPDFLHPTFRRWLLESRYTVDDTGQFDLDQQFKRIELTHGDEDLSAWGLSGLLYDPWRRGLWISLSREVGEGQPFQARLFFLRDRERASGRMQAVADMDASGPWIAPFKIEGLAFADRNTLIAICDEDRTQSPVRVNDAARIRQLHQGVFLRIRLH